MKKNLLFVVLATMCLMGIYAQVPDTTIGVDITGDAIVYAKVQLNDVDGLGVYNSGISLSQDSVKAWGDASCFVRFSNAASNTQNPGGIIDVRNGGEYSVMNEQISFATGQTFHIWMEVAFTAQTYNVYVQTETGSSPVKIFTDAAFRKTDPTSLAYLSSVRHTGESVNTISVLDYALTDTIGIRQAPSSVDIAGNMPAFSFYPNPVQDVINISGIENISEVSVLDCAGRRIMVISRVENNGINVSKLEAGVYVVSVKLANGKVASRQVIKK
ncbi:MAG: T9SS type A sorting domain-containing protein [Bacteroidales bacterium]|nr:T9SS type A sorting domain-containing protein [Bacteroidales bacterium]